MEFKPSPLQQTIFDWTENKSGSAIIEAVAGSGKTTTIVQALNLIPRDLQVAFLAFNKSIAVELQSRVPEQVQAMTLNSAGYRALRKFLSKGRKIFIKLDGRKSAGLIRQITDEATEGYLEEISKLVALAKSHGIVPSYIRSATGLMEDTMESWWWLIDRFDVDIRSSMVPAVVDVVREVLAAGLRERQIIDFDDQLYMPVVLGARFDTYDWLFVDEAQDVSPIQRAMLRKMLKPGGRLVAVGDRSQAIYGFRGSDSESLNNIAREFNATRLPLSISYRCPKTVVMYAQKVVNHIEASDAAPEGTVMSLPVYLPADFGVDDMVVCRLTAPLISLAYALIGRRVPVRVMGRDIGKGLVNLIERLKPKGISGEHGLKEKLEDWKDRECQKLLTKGKEDKITGIEDKFDSIMAFIRGTGATTVPKLKEEINQMFADDKSRKTTLCTIHKAKGLEAEKVFILDADLMPSKWARQDWQLEQERNLEYVAITRAKQELVFIRSGYLAYESSRKVVAAA